MPHLVKIGNSQGIRIPKPYIEEAHLSGNELKFELVHNGLLVSPIKKARQDWEKAIDMQLTKQSNGNSENQEWLDAPLTSDEDLEW
jgi:antitoxin MazE